MQLFNSITMQAYYNTLFEISNVKSKNIFLHYSFFNAVYQEPVHNNNEEYSRLLRRKYFNPKKKPHI